MTLATDRPIPIVRARGIGKRFGGTVALDGVDLDVYPAEVHAVVGENGAGKSTLMKILGGAITDYTGQLYVNGEPVRFSGPRDAEHAGISIIYQELNLVEHLSAAANIFLGRELRRGWGLLDDRRMEQEAAQVFAQLGAEIDPSIEVSHLRVGDQQLVEIARALSLKTAVLIMDEPTSALSEAEVEKLFRVIRELKSKGVAILYISHKMAEVFAIADRITVLRDGHHIRTMRRAETTPEEVVSLMVGRQIASLHFDEPRSPGEPLLEVEHFTVPMPRANGRPWVNDVTFTLRRGEILGVAGLLGAGRTELLEGLFGATPVRPIGEVRLDGRVLEIRSPLDAMKEGIAFVAEDRKRQGLFPELSVGENITMAALRQLAQLGVVPAARERTTAEGVARELSIKYAGLDAPVTSLSGGNQQKCILARWLLTKPRVLLLDEPTRGIDVGAKAEIYVLMDQLARRGLGIIMTSSELPELLSVCDRILVLCEGEKTAEFSREEATEEKIMAAATNLLRQEV